MYFFQIDYQINKEGPKGDEDRRKLRAFIESTFNHHAIAHKAKRSTYLIKGGLLHYSPSSVASTILESGYIDSNDFLMVTEIGLAGIAGQLPPSLIRWAETNGLSNDAKSVMLDEGLDHALRLGLLRRP
jgi:hypothetical protein